MAALEKKEFDWESSQHRIGTKTRIHWQANYHTDLFPGYDPVSFKTWCVYPWSQDPCPVTYLDPVSNGGTMKKTVDISDSCSGFKLTNVLFTVFIVKAAHREAEKKMCVSLKNLLNWKNLWESRGGEVLNKISRRSIQHGNYARTYRTYSFDIEGFLLKWAKLYAFDMYSETDSFFIALAVKIKINLAQYC